MISACIRTFRGQVTDYRDAFKDFGHNARRLTRAFGKGASDAQLVTRYATDPLMGGTAMNVNFVSLDPRLCDLVERLPCLFV